MAAAFGLLALLLTLSAPASRAWGVEVIARREVAHAGRTLLAPNECVTKGLQGTCNGCVCCCYTGGAGIVTYEPTDTCTCARIIETSQIWSTVILSVILVACSLMVQLYFGGSLRISPYPRRDAQQQQQPPPPPPQQPASWQAPSRHASRVGSAAPPPAGMHPPTSLI